MEERTRREKKRGIEDRFEDGRFVVVSAVVKPSIPIELRAELYSYLRKLRRAFVRNEKGSRSIRNAPRDDVPSLPFYIPELLIHLRVYVQLYATPRSLVKPVEANRAGCRVLTAWRPSEPVAPLVVIHVWA